MSASDPLPVAPAAAAEAGVPEMSGAARAAIYAYSLLAVGSSLEPGLVPHLGLPLIVAALAVAFRGATLTRRRGAPFPFPGLHFCLSALGSLPLVLSPPGPHAPWYGTATLVLGALSPLVLALHASGPPRLGRRALLGLAGLALALVVLTPVAVPHPVIDVWQWTQHCVRTLLHGGDPYATQAPDIYNGAFDFGYTISVYSYLPLNLLLSLPGVALFGDYRYMLVASTLASAAFLRAAGRRLDVEPRLLDLLTLALLLHPRAAFIVGMGWKEPFMVVALAAFVYFQVRSPGGAAQAVAFFLLPALKQYVLGPLVLYFGLRPRKRAVLLGMLAAAATALPFLAWNPSTVLHGAVLVMRQTACRPDSSSLPGLLVRFAGAGCWKELALVVQLAVAGAAFVWLRHQDLAGFLVGSALSLLTGFLFASQAFLNYYYFVGALLLFAALVLSGRATPSRALGPESAVALPVTTPH